VEPLALPVTIETLWTASKMALGFLAAMFAAARFLPGIERVGYPQPDGTRKRYTLTGMPTFLLSNMVLGAVVVARALGGGVSLTPVLAHFWSLLIVALVLSMLFTLVLLAWGRRAGPVCRSPESTDLPIPEWTKTFWFGNECNPELFGVDLKMFFYQPSLIGAYLLNVSFAFAQWDRHGFVTPQMLCLCFFWFTYLFTHYVKEEFMLSTWDVMAENLGFMLVWGDLTYLPFLYSIPGWWMVDATESFSTTTLALLVAFHFAALAIFRQSNWQKARFKQDPTAPIWGRPPRLVGGKLLAAGYGGIGR
jgi:delta14-sterol reductase